MIVLSTNIVARAQELDLELDNPVIGWENLVTTGNVSSGNPNDGSSDEDPDNPTINLANTSTAQWWAQATAGQDVFLRVDIGGGIESDYIAVAGHNFGSSGRAVRVYGATETDGLGNPSYAALTQELIPADDSPLLFRFDVGFYISLKIEALATGDDIAQAAVLYAGKLLEVERKVQVSFTPMPYGRQATVVNQRSERGLFLGRVIVGEWIESSCNLSHLSPDWFREFMDPFLENALTEPFFFAWAPQSYPYEVGYAWLQQAAIPEIFDNTELWRVTLDMQGIAS